VRVRALAGFAVVATLATLAASVAGGLPLGALDSPSGGRSAAVGTATLSGGEEASSQAITSESGPFHPIRVSEGIDYGDAGAVFGASRYGHSHEGQDMFAESGTPLIAVRDGLVIRKGYDGGRGNYVGIYSETEDQTYVYLHMLRRTPLDPGDQVAAGMQVGTMGCTGSCYGTHLHFEVRVGKGINRKPIDPLPLLKQWPQAP
jgi:murein DD-endopeptidase MepM/ murein hydrolase activator NlpD